MESGRDEGQGHGSVFLDGREDESLTIPQAQRAYVLWLAVLALGHVVAGGMKNIDVVVLLAVRKGQNNWDSRMMKNGVSHGKNHSVDQGADKHLVRPKKQNVYCHHYANALIAYLCERYSGS